MGGIGLGPPWPEFDPVEVFDFEGGWKGSWLDNRVQTQLGAYYQTLDDFQGVFAAPNDVLGSTIRNAGGTSTIYGIEVSAQAQFAQVGFDVAASWNVTELGSLGDVVIPGELLQWFPGAMAGDTVNLSNAESPYSPEFTVSLGVEYLMRFGDTTITPRVDFAYIDEQKDGLYDIPILALESRELVNVQVGFEHGAWYGRAFADNVFDHTYIGGIQALGQLRYLGPPTVSAWVGGSVRRWLLLLEAEYVMKFLFMLIAGFWAALAAAAENEVIGTIEATIEGEPTTWYLLQPPGDVPPTALWVALGPDTGATSLSAFASADLEFVQDATTGAAVPASDTPVLLLSFSFPVSAESVSHALPVGVDAVPAAFVLMDNWRDMLNQYNSSDGPGEIQASVIDARKNGPSTFEGTFHGTMAGPEGTRRLTDGRFSIRAAQYHE